jgi:hypothetical protein
MSASKGALNVSKALQLPFVQPFIPMQNPWTALAAAREGKLADSAAQKHDIAKPSVVTR